MAEEGARGGGYLNIRAFDYTIGSSVGRQGKGETVYTGLSHQSNISFSNPVTYVS